MISRFVASLLLPVLTTADPVPGSPATQAATQPTPANAIPGKELTSQISELLGKTFAETTFTGWLILLAGIFVGVAGAKLVSSLCKSLGERMKQRQWPVRAAIFGYAAGPASLALFALGLGLGFTGPIVTKDVAGFEVKLVAFLYILAIGWFMYNLIDLIDFGLHRLTAKSATRVDDTVITLLRKALRIFLLIMFVLFVAENFFNANISAWLAGLGIAGLAVSLAAQDSIKNLFGSLTVLIERPFGLGDRIVFGTYDGTVENIGLRSSKIRTITGNLVTIPNMRFTDGSIENITARPFLGRSFTIGLTYDTPPDRIEHALKIIRDVLASPGVVEAISIPGKPARASFADFGPDSLNINISYSYDIKTAGRDMMTYQDHTELVNLRLLRALADAEIEIAFKTQTLYLANDPARQLSMRVVQDLTS